MEKSCRFCTVAEELDGFLPIPPEVCSRIMRHMADGQTEMYIGEEIGFQARDYGITLRETMELLRPFADKCPRYPR